jgi:hypothetical protein
MCTWGHWRSRLRRREQAALVSLRAQHRRFGPVPGEGAQIAP